MKHYFVIASIFAMATFTASCTNAVEKKSQSEITSLKENVQKKTLEENLKDFLKDLKAGKMGIIPFNNPKLDTVIIDTVSKTICININGDLSTLPFREKLINDLYTNVKSYIGDQYKSYSLSIKTKNIPIEDLIPNFYRTDKAKLDLSRLPKSNFSSTKPVVENISKPFSIDKGLYNRNILLWHSHGWYYNNDLDRWEWQRPRLFESVEDKVPMSFVLPYILPMLENAGANVFIPRERDFQINEVITDNDSKPYGPKKPEYKEVTKNRKNRWQTCDQPGFAYGNPPYNEGYNPFTKGTVRFIKTDTTTSAEASWIPDIPETGEYGIYISYSSTDKSVSDALYTVYHAGGKTEFHINQKIGGSTWIYLGKFKFLKGYYPEMAKVTLSNKSCEGNDKIITADAVRFGGGMGLVSRNGFTSGRPKFLEAARYWLQFAGMPDTLVYNLNNGTNDYNDDYQGRGEYGNYLKGAPFGPNRNKMEKGLGIPIDLSFAFHTDAGITKNDTSIGTLSIYSSEGNDKKSEFPDGQSRITSRDYADIVQTQIVDDIRKEFDPVWNRRQLMDARYSEAKSPNVPGMLVELLSHQNFLDMKYELDPRFRFVVSRAIYKGMLKYLANSYGFEYVVQPLSVDHFQAILNPDGGSATLKWKPVIDPLESTAAAKNYVVYTRIDNGGFDNGQLTNQTEFTIHGLKSGAIYSFKVTAVNEGGESFPSEILSVCLNEKNRKPVLIINGFDRICGPASINSPEMTGFLDNEDAGVPDKYLLGYTGQQFDFNFNSPFVTNDAPGHGASHADCETDIIAGNSFDYPYVHGKAIKESGYSFSSCSNEAVCDKMVDMNNYKFVDLILGEEKETHFQKAIMDSLKGTQFKAFPAELQSAILSFCQSGGNLFISGAYVASDLFKGKAKDNPDVKFGKEVLKINLATDHASKSGNVFSSSNDFMQKMNILNFNTKLSPDIYAVEAPDAIAPEKEASTILRYDENKFSAAAAYKKDYGVIVFGFPFETILTDESRNAVMRSILNYFGMNPLQVAGH